MVDFLFLIPIALTLGVIGLGAFLWSLKSGQYEDLDGAAERILFDDDASLAGNGPIATPPQPRNSQPAPDPVGPPG
jgi:cbb3-type cytochrome oxidase maturation protein